MIGAIGAQDAIITWGVIALITLLSVGIGYLMGFIEGKNLIKRSKK